MNMDLNAVATLVIALTGALAGWSAFKSSRDAARQSYVATIEQSFTKQIGLLTERIATLEQHIDAQDATVRALRARIAELEAQNTQKDLRIAELESEIKRLKTHEAMR